eukprot:c27484_g1_i1 orf=1118-2512(-)
MPVFSVTALDRLIEPAGSRSSTEPPTMERSPPYSFYPLLYTTPYPQRPTSPPPSSSSPSPYVVNHKRRVPLQHGGTESGRIQQQNGFQISRPVAGQQHVQQEKEKSPEVGNAMPQLKFENFTEPTVHNAEGTSRKTALRGGICGSTSPPTETISKKLTEVPLQDVGNEAFGMRINGSHLQEKRISSPHWNSSALSMTIGKKCSRQQTEFTDERSVVSSHGSSSVASITEEEFFDAPDAPLEDTASEEASTQFGAFMSQGQITKDKLDKSMVLRLQEEILRRIRVEEALASLQLHWYETAQRFTSIGLMLPLRPGEGSSSIQMERQVTDLFEQFNQRLLVARLVGGALARATAKAEKEEELENLLVSKNREIARLRDKLQYYELVNHEISQRSQEAVEMGHRRRQRWWKRQQWALSCIAGVLFLSTTALVTCKFLPWKEAKLWNLRLGSSTSEKRVGLNLLAGSE